MRLQTLGDLSLEGSGFSRPKPLLLLAYLTLEGPKVRGDLADLFFVRARDRRDSLSSALRNLKREARVPLLTEGDRVWSDISCDAKTLIEHLDHGQNDVAVELYSGAFLAGLNVSLGEELQEWVYEIREGLAARIQKILIDAAEVAAGGGNFQDAASTAETALTLPGAAPLEPEDLQRLHTLLVGAEHHAAREVQRQAEEYGVELAVTTTEARGKLRRVFIGRREELARLSRLSSGEWAWVQGGLGIGKTSLLRQLPGTHLVGRSGLPFATLEPYVGARTGEGGEAVLQYLLNQDGALCLDDWDEADEESRLLLTRFRSFRPRLKVIVSSATPPPFAVDMLIELTSLPHEALEEHKVVWDLTGGIPSLVGAHLRGEPLAEALQGTLSAASETAREVYFALALLEDPDLSLVRRALDIGAAEMAGAIHTLSGAGLITASGRAWPRQLSRSYLDAHPVIAGRLALRLAPHLTSLKAFPLFRLARPLWSDEHLHLACKAYLSWAASVLERGFPQQVASILEEAPADPEVCYLKGAALIYEGFYPRALEVLEAADETLDVLALKSAVLWRLGRSAEAKRAAESALSGSMRARAVALETLGELARSRGNFVDATALYRRSATVWQALGSHLNWVMNLNNAAIALYQLGEDLNQADAAYKEALDVAGDNPLLRSFIEMNIALEWERAGAYDRAIDTFENVIRVAQQMKLPQAESRAWNNLALCFEHQGRIEEARRTYRQALALAQETEEVFMLGLTLANLAELNRDLPALEEALAILESGGHHAMAERFRGRLYADEAWLQSARSDA